MEMELGLRTLLVRLFGPVIVLGFSIVCFYLYMVNLMTYSPSQLFNYNVVQDCNVTKYSKTYSWETVSCDGHTLYLNIYSNHTSLVYECKQANYFNLYVLQRYEYPNLVSFLEIFHRGVQAGLSQYDALFGLWLIYLLKSFRNFRWKEWISYIVLWVQLVALNVGVFFGMENVDGYSCVVSYDSGVWNWLWLIAAIILFIISVAGIFYVLWKDKFNFMENLVNSYTPPTINESTYLNFSNRLYGDKNKDSETTKSDV